MIDVNTAKRELHRLTGLSFPPTEKEAMTTLAKMLMRFAASEDHAALVIAKWIESWPQWPKPSELKQLCEAIPDPRQASARAAREQCEMCDGTGYREVQGEFGITAAATCHHGPLTDADKRAGVRFTPALRRMYSQEQIAAEARADVWIGSGGKPNAEALKKIMAGI